MSASAPSFDLERFLGEERESVERALERALSDLLPLLQPELVEPTRHAVTTGGKRLRPILCVAAYRAAGGAGSEAAEDLGVALELIHAYSLMHDDLPCMDDAPLRRGEATPHTVYGEAETMRAGLLLIPLAGLQAWESALGLGTGPERARVILKLLSRAAGIEGMVGGQALDLLAEGRVLQRPEMDELHRMKTGALLTAAARIGAVASGVGYEVQQAFGRYGSAIGLAFQITDDVLDATAEADVLGKLPSDVELEKSTYVVLLGVEAARAEAERLIEEGLRALAQVGIVSEPLEGLAWYAARRDR